MSKCIFCKLPQIRNIIVENEHAFVIFDKYPVTEGHTLIITKRHVRDYFGTTPEEKEDLSQLITAARKNLFDKDSTISGFNIGVNCGESAGQTIFHCHIHLIPRRKGDVENPRGGIRNIIPGKGSY